MTMMNKKGSPMKKIIFSTMIALLLVFVGCQNEELVNDNNTDNSGKKVTLTAHIQGSADSRVALTPEISNGATTVMVDWRNSGEKEVFQVACFSSNGFSAPTTFTQVEGSQFTGTIPSDITPLGFWATYGGTMDESGWDYDLSQQYGTLNEDFVLMEAIMEGATLPTTIDFEHKTAILQPTFTGVGMGEIKQIVMSGVENEISPINKATGQITITPTDAQNGIYVFLTMPNDNNETYISNHTFRFTVTASGTVTASDKVYTGSLTIPNRKSIEAGKFYTANIKLTEVITYCYLPSGAIFNAALCDILDDNSTVTAIEFVAGSNLEGTEVYNENVSTSYVELNYKIVNNTLQLHTSANKFKFPADCSSMFVGYDGEETSMDQITTIQFNGCIDTSEVTNMSEMFYDCRDLTTIDLSSFNTSKVTEMNDMFCGCSSLTSLDLSSFNTSKVTEMIGMFYGCSSLISLDLSSFNTSNVTTMNNMFASSRLLSSITFGDKFTTSEVTDMLAMFEECSALTTLDLSFFNTSKVTNMARMFNGCSSLTTLNLSSFTADNVGSMNEMFNECGKLEELHLENFKPTTTDERHYFWMFHVGSELEDPKRTKIYVATPNPFENWIDQTHINDGKAYFIE